MRLDPILAKASRLARAGRHREALGVLQPEVTRYERSFVYFYLLGAVCLRAGEFGSALTYLRLAHEIKPRDARALLGLAALYLRRGDTTRAVDFYLDALDIDGSCRKAKRALRMIRRRAGSDDFPAWLESGPLRGLFPPIPFTGPSPRSFAIVAGSVIAFLALGAGIVEARTGLVSGLLRQRGDREIPAELVLAWSDRISPLGEAQEGGLSLSPGEAIATYERALSLFSDRRDEAARLQLNRIVESNASEGLVNRALLMLSLLETPGFDTYRREDNVSYAAAWQEPALYKGVHVIWRGVAANASITEEGTNFDFLLGADAPRIVEGMVPVYFQGAVPTPDSAIEVLGRIVQDESTGRIRLEGVAIRLNL
ncbi:MAG: tetratricopeptide repeat protein [Treponema sp.]|nr:tetratricopeptide repeat protein [Treponema sp.]